MLIVIFIYFFNTVYIVLKKIILNFYYIFNYIFTIINIHKKFTKKYKKIKKRKNFNLINLYY